MGRARFLGITLLSGCGLAVLAAVGLGVTAVEQDWQAETVVQSTAILAIAAEAMFWAGGGLLGFEAIQKRKASLHGLATKLTFWRRD